MNYLPKLENLLNDFLIQLKNDTAFSEENEMPRKIKIAGKLRTIRKRADGRWEMRFTYNKKTHSVYHTKQEVCIANFKKLYDKREKLSAGGSEYDIKTLNDWLDIWYKTYKEPNLAPSSLESIRLARSTYIDKTLGKLILKSITTLQIQNALNKIPGSRVRQITKNHLSNAFRYAVKNKLIKENPMEGVEVKHKTRHKSVLTVTQQKDLLAAIPAGPFKILIVLYLQTGLRRNEALTLALSDIDTVRCILKVRGTKTEKSVREVPVSVEMIEKLKSVAAGDKIFTLTGTTIDHKFRALCDGLGLTNVTIHSLRHTYATNCLRAGIPMKLVQYWLGHSSVALTSDLYTHVTDDIVQNELAKLQRLFEQQSPIDPTFDPNE